ncbi:hypothetical protein QJS10_CPB17g02044 [Acorus calamus]|uniref:Uncharacterized protein n=1 Tax=Acorus calamus TaxID=4465 RepID=A0AAV9CX69_ACOCL|nr:hypothetical protein QJS10_CPB17g02044 [Acorus calamus]
MKKVLSMLCKMDDPFESMITVDILQRLGVDHHFDEEIMNIVNSLQHISLGGYNGSGFCDLRYVALRFRLLRQHGHYVSSDVFDKFLDCEGRFELSLSKDVKGLLGLYEASHLSVGEEILDDAKDFTSKNLKASMAYLEPRMFRLVDHTLKYPFHTSIPKYHFEFHLNHYRDSQMNTLLEELATSEFAILRTLHQEEMREIKRWWRDLGLAQELNLTRDNPAKWFMWAMVMLPDPRFSRYRIELTKPISLIYIIDDIFDVLGSHEDLIRFTEAIDRWDVNTIDSLPRYMKICYMALYNITNEIACFVFKEHGWNPIDSLRRAWGKLCNAYLTEAKWFTSGRVPKADEYLKNAVISTGAHMVYVHIFFLLGEVITKESIETLEGCPTMIYSLGKILRLWNDLGNAKVEKQERFDGSYLDYYLKEHPNSSMESGKKHVEGMIWDAWKSLNKECLSPEPFSRGFARASLDGARIVRVMYDHDGVGRLPELEKEMKSLLHE